MNQNQNQDQNQDQDQDQVFDPTLHNDGFYNVDQWDKPKIKPLRKPTDKVLPEAP